MKPVEAGFDWGMFWQAASAIATAFAAIYSNFGKQGIKIAKRLRLRSMKRNLCVWWFFGTCR